MPAKKFSQLNEIIDLSGNEEVPVVYQGANLKVKLQRIRSLVTKADVGLPLVDNTPDLNKPISNATQGALNGKANAVHAHQIGDVTGLTAALLSKADEGHGHPIADVTGLSEMLATKSDTTHSHPLSGLPEVQNELASKAAISHAHNMADITGLGNALLDKANATHNHIASDISDFIQTVESVLTAAGIAAAEVDVTNIEW